MAGVARFPRAVPPDAHRRLQRLRALAWLLDRSIGVGPKARFGLDPILGLVPGVGDWLGGLLSLYIVYEGMRLGLSWPVIGRMLGNVAVETVAGAVPVAGDVFDFWWQANIRNLQLVEKHYRPSLAPRSLRSIGWLVAGLAVLVLATLAGAIAISVWLIARLWSLITG